MENFAFQFISVVTLQCLSFLETNKSHDLCVEQLVKCVSQIIFLGLAELVNQKSVNNILCRM